MKGYADILHEYSLEGRLRTLPSAMPGIRYNLSDNDYLGLAARVTLPPHILTGRFTASASRLLATECAPHAELEDLLASLYGRPALLFGSGYHLNVGAISALAIPGTLILSDRLNHASMIDGIRLSGAPCRRFRHNDMAAVERIILAEQDHYDRLLLITESVFSMDGDLAPLADLVALRRRYPKLMLYVDEAHAFGVMGERGLGLAEHLGLIPEIDCIVGTFGKAAASAGAFITASAHIISFLVNTARSLIFSTALPPLNSLITHYMIEQHILPAAPARRHLARISMRFREQMESITGQSSPSRSQIVPLLVGDPVKVVQLSRRLRDRGVLALPIRRPTVPPGTERIRFSLNAALTEEDVDTITRIIRTAL